MAVLPKWIKVSEALKFTELAHPNFSIDKAKDFLSRTKVNMDHKVKELSKGMTAQLHLAIVMSIDAKLLVLDEPTNGLDPQGIVEVRNLLIEIGSRGKTILLASHIIDEVEKVCNHVAILKYGDLIAAGSVAEILGGEPIIEVSAPDLQQLKSTLSELNFVTDLKEDGSILALKMTEETTAIDLNRALFEKGIVLSHLHVRKKSLEAEFLERTS